MFSEAGSAFEGFLLPLCPLFITDLFGLFLFPWPVVAPSGNGGHLRVIVGSMAPISTKGREVFQMARPFGGSLLLLFSRNQTKKKPQSQVARYIPFLVALKFSLCFSTAKRNIPGIWSHAIKELKKPCADANTAAYQRLKDKRMLPVQVGFKRSYCLLQTKQESHVALGFFECIAAVVESGSY